MAARTPGEAITHTITFEIRPADLARVTDTTLATYWHIAQANPAPLGDRKAGDLAEAVGFEIIRRWLGKAPAELYHHQPHHYYWNQLRQLGKWIDGEFVPGAHRDSNGALVIPDAPPDARPAAGGDQ